LEEKESSALVPANSLGKESTFNKKSLTAHFDNVVHTKLAAPASLLYSVHFDFTVLDHELGMTTGVGNASQFQELIQTKSSGFGFRIRHGRGFL
jgi:hypothetical protein